VRLDEIRGHERVRAVLSRALERDRLPPALLLDGPEGVGKRTLALAVAQAALCERAPVPEPCGVCRACQKIAAAARPSSLAERRQEADRHADQDLWRNFRLHPDLVLAEGWWLTRTGRPRSEPEIRVEQVRDLVREIAGAPFEAGRRVFVIDDAHTMNDAAQNALLKSLEEPASRSHVILVSSSATGLRPTIRSRCQRLRFGPLSRALVSELLQRERGLDADAAALQAALAGGSLAEALAHEPSSELALRDELLELLERLVGADAMVRMQAAETLEQSEDPAALFLSLRSLLRDLAALRAGAAPASLLNPDRADRLAALAGGPLGERAIDLAAAAEDTREALRGFAGKLLSFDRLVNALAGEPA
jgi:DNA polymerase III subunit delta'